MTMKPELVEEDRDRPGDLRTMRGIVHKSCCPADR